MVYTDEQRDFIVSLATMGCFYTNKYHFPVAAMVACGCLESGYGTSHHYIATHCPFNLQKPANWIYPQCPVTPPRETFKDREGTQKTRVQFCIATDLGDSARLFCEWIAYWPDKNVSIQLKAVGNNAIEFARRLPRVGFGTSLKAGGKSPGDEYVRAVTEVSTIIPFELIAESSGASAAPNP
jgi:hypothetical protein